MKVCEVCGITDAETAVIKSRKLGMTVCNKHRNQLYRHGKTFERTEKDRNEIRILESHAEVVMINREGEEVVAIVDIHNVERIDHFKWRYANGYATTMIDKIPVTMHRMIMGAGDSDIVDHEDRNKLNNLESNLRKASKANNSMNTDVRSNNQSGFTGVGFMKSKGKWRAYIKLDSKNKHLGLFSEIEDAVKARLTAEKEMFGEFAPQRHLFEEYGI